MKGVYGVFLREQDGHLSDMLIDFSTLHILDTINDLGSWSMESVSKSKCPFVPGMGIVVVRNNAFCYSGVVDQIQDVKDAVTGLYTWQVQGVSDLEYLNRRLCYVDPDTGRTDEYGHYEDTGQLSEVVETLIAKNLGQDALEERREPIIEANENAVGHLAYGPEVSAYLRFQNLLTAVKALCVANLYSIRPVWDNDNMKIYYEVFQGRDLSNGIVFTEQLNNVSQTERIAVSPECNFIIGGGVGEMEEREFATAQDDDSIAEWGRIESYLDVRNEHNIEKHVQDDLKKKAGDRSGYSVTASDADNAPQYGVDYRVGDFVSMKIDDTYVAAQVQQCQIDVSEGSETVSPKFGTVAIGRFKNIYSQLDSLRQDVNELLGTEIE